MRAFHWLCGALLVLGALGGVVFHAAERRHSPARCAAGLEPQGARCCGLGQRVEHGRCTGFARSCASTQLRSASGACVVEPHRIAYAAASFVLGASDWEGGEPEPTRVETGAFYLDRAELTRAVWDTCVAASACAPAAIPGEPGEPVRGVPPERARDLCRFLGGRLPRSEEWLRAAAGTRSRRYPWGNTGLVCRRAAFGLASGPCASGASGPELAGSRPAGQTPEGALDLAGNVAEWVEERDGQYRARGGSYRSTSAAELKSWSSQAREPFAADVGFRCAYDHEPNGSASWQE